MNYGQLLFQAMEPIFQNSICTNWKDDFLVHDCRVLERVAVPGIQFIWVIKECGTHLIPLEFDSEEATDRTLGALGHPEDPRQVFHVSLAYTQAKIKPVTREQALAMAKAKAPLTLRIMHPSYGRDETSVVIMRGEETVASASVSITCPPMSANKQANVRATVPDILSPLNRMHCKLLLELAVNRITSTLFWTFDQFEVNSRPVGEWLSSITRVPDAQPSLIAA